MKIEEAIKAMRNLDEVISITVSEHESVRLAIKALEKQMLKKPIEASQFTNSYVFEAHICPSCEERVFTHYSCCPECGQKLDWSEEQ